MDKSSVPLVTPQKWFKAMKLPATKKGDPPNRKYKKIDPYEKALANWKPRPPVSPGAYLPLYTPLCNLHSTPSQTRSCTLATSEVSKLLKEISALANRVGVHACRGQGGGHQADWAQGGLQGSTQQGADIPLNLYTSAISAFLLHTALLYQRLVFETLPMLEYLYVLSFRPSKLSRRSRSGWSTL